MTAQKRSYSELFLNYLTDLACLRLRLSRFRPLITNYYVTKRCNMRCRYCYPPGDEPELGLSEALALLEKIRPHNPVINFTGGEPILVGHLPALLRRARELRFYPIILSTNGLRIESIVDDLQAVDHLILSLDSLAEDVNDGISGAPGVTKVIKENIRRCAALASEKNFRLSLHAVIAPETISGIGDILSFCESLSITLSLSPEHGRFDPHSGLRDNEAYRCLIDTMIDRKRRGGPLACSYGYLRTIRDFAPHRCYPFFSPRVEPDGRVYFPCQRIRARHVFLQDYESLSQLMQQEAEQVFLEDCARRCFLACYVDVEQYLKTPLSLLSESPIREWVFGRRN